MECVHKDSESTKTWLGSSLTDLCKGKGPWSFALGSVNPSKYHTVLYELPVTLQKPPKPHHSSQKKLWDVEHVMMPFCDQNLFPVKENGEDVIKKRWTVIKNVLSKPIRSVSEFELALNQYNSLPKFEMLDYFFNEVMEESDSREFFMNLLPKIVKLALRLPELIPCGIPLLQQNHNRSLSVSQLQISCLLANAFLCTFPWKKNVPTNCPGVNFVMLYASLQRPNRIRCVCEKFKCILNYFEKVTRQEPCGVVTFERKIVPRSNMPKWDSLEREFINTKIHINSEGTIEDAEGFLQVDFANKNIGGGVLRYGCVQEEIRFVICPELIASRLFVEQLNNGEAVVITGIERFSNYTGYGDTFEFSGNHDDTTPHDLHGRRRTTICVIDAVKFNRSQDQFRGSMIMRELNKAFVGFSTREKENVAPVATGNWGCGAFNGNKQLKSLLQLMACNVAGRHLVYYSFGDRDLMLTFHDMYYFLIDNKITIKQLMRFLGQISTSPSKQDTLYSYIKQAYFDSKKQPSISRFFKESPAVIKKEKLVFQSPKKEQRYSKNSKMEEDIDMYLSTSSSSEDIIPGTPPSQHQLSCKKLDRSRNKTQQEDIPNKLPKVCIAAIIDILDGNANQSKSEPASMEPESIEEKGSTQIVETMEVDILDTNLKNQQKKITDYFQNSNKK